MQGLLLSVLRAALCDSPRLVPPRPPHWFPRQRALNLTVSQISPNLQNVPQEFLQIPVLNVPFELRCYFSFYLSIFLLEFGVTNSFKMLIEKMDGSTPMFKFLVQLHLSFGLKVTFNFRIHISMYTSSFEFILELICFCVFGVTS